MKIHRYSNAEGAAEACAAHILKRLKASGASASLAVSGGSSPRRMFEIFAGSHFDWERLHVFWVDERVVPPTDSQSNYKLAFDTWLKPANFPAANVHRVQTELGPQQAARQYEDDIRNHFQLKAGGVPAFDVIHRGMGPDGHTASLFPGEPLISEGAGIAEAVWVEKMNQWRVTLLPGVLEAGLNTVMLVTGVDKAAVLREVIEGKFQPSEYPAQIASRDEKADWFLDEAAAGELSAGE